MRAQIRTGCVVATLALGVLAIACGGGSTSPDGKSDSSFDPYTNPGGNAGTCSVPVGVLGCARGLILAKLDGAAYRGGLSAGNAIYTPIPANPQLGIPALDFIVMVGVASNNSQVSITTRAKVRTSDVGLNVFDPDIKNVSVNSISYILPNGSGVASGWSSGVAGGSGSITVEAVSTTAARGRFSVEMIPSPGTPATGIRKLEGSFNVTF